MPSSIEPKVRSTYFADLFRDFDGESPEEQQNNWDLGFKAENSPEKLTPKQAFTVSFILERIQSYASRCGKQIDVCKLEELRHTIMEGLVC